MAPVVLGGHGVVVLLMGLHVRAKLELGVFVEIDVCAVYDGPGANCVRDAIFGGKTV